MKIIEDTFCDENGSAIAFINDETTIYNIHNIVINITDNKFYLEGGEITDTALLEHKDQILRLGESTRYLELESMKKELELLKPFNDLLYKKIQYALEYDYFVDDYYQCVYTVHYKHEESNGGKIFTIGEFKFPVIYSDLDDEEIVGLARHEFIRRMCEPYSSVVKSARNFVL